MSGVDIEDLLPPNMKAEWDRLFERLDYYSTKIKTEDCPPPTPEEIDEIENINIDFGAITSRIKREFWDQLDHESKSLIDTIQIGTAQLAETITQRRDDYQRRCDEP